MSITRLVATCVCFGSIVLNVASAEEALLRWKLHAGETLRYELHRKNSIKEKIGDQKSERSTDLTLDLTWKVKVVSGDRKAEVEMVIDRVQVDLEFGAEKAKFDSKENVNDTPIAKLFSSVYSPAVGRTYSLTIDDRGRVVEAKVPSEVTEALRASPLSASADGGSVLSGIGLQNLLGHLIPVFPETPVSTGSTWSTEVQLPGPPMRVSLLFKDSLASRDDRSATIDATIATKISPEPGTPFTVDLKKQSGLRSVSFDTKTGRISESKITQSLELTLGSMNRETEQVIGLEARMTLVP